jgi:hypothetical protein
VLVAELNSARTSVVELAQLAVFAPEGVTVT